MDVCQDYEELFKVLNSAEIKYLVVGSHAYFYHAEPRYTKDVDVWIFPEINKPEEILKALKEFGAPTAHLTLDDFENKDMIIQIGVPPVRVDIMMAVPGLSFEKAWKNRKKAVYGKTTIHVLGFEDLLQSKRTANRPQDRLDVIRLLESRNKKKR